MDKDDNSNISMNTGKAKKEEETYNDILKTMLSEYSYSNKNSN